MKNILVIGGAGYIGSHMCKYLHQNNYTPIVLDNLSLGHKEAVKWGELIVGSINNEELLSKIFTKYKISGVMHFAAFAAVGESVSNPIKYYQNNVADTITLLKSMIEHNVNNFIFSSSAATYGEPSQIPITETHSTNPINPYGRTKLIVEHILADFRIAYNLRSTCLRYFNAAGADPDCEIGEVHNPETHLIPLILQTALGQRKEISIFGDDYQTKDGTCIRDYIHVMDLAQAHLRALQQLENNDPGNIYNLGNGEGFSVKEIIESARKITQKDIPITITSRRSGDPAILISSSQKAKKDLGWTPMFTDIEKIIETAWKWHSTHPNGYLN